MPQAPRTTCRDRSCPHLRPCALHDQQAERARGTRQQRGYDRKHDQLREQWRPHVETGEIRCHAIACLMDDRRIPIGAAWDLGHTADRKGWTGPEHERCNRSAGGKAAHARDGAR